MVDFANPFVFPNQPLAQFSAVDLQLVAASNTVTHIGPKKPGCTVLQWLGTGGCLSPARGGSLGLIARASGCGLTQRRNFRQPVAVVTLELAQDEFSFLQHRRRLIT